MSVEGKKTKDKIGDMKVQVTKMKPNVPNKELSTDGSTLMTPDEVEWELNYGLPTSKNPNKKNKPKK